jgi:8-oxo-dGTP pyrophosphatase MutT (NUDIX family)
MEKKEFHIEKKISRIGAYGLAFRENKILLVTQDKGPFKGLYDLPGGGIDFGEEIEEALRREFIEETASDFSSSRLFSNFSATTSVPSNGDKPGFNFHQIGLIYIVEGLHELAPRGELIKSWIHFNDLTKEKMAPLAWLAGEKFFSINR